MRREISSGSVSTSGGGLLAAGGYRRENEAAAKSGMLLNLALEMEYNETEGKCGGGGGWRGNLPLYHICTGGAKILSGGEAASARLA